MTGDQDQAAVERQQLQFAIRVRTGLGIEDDVNAPVFRRFKQRLNPIRFVVQGNFRTEVTADLALGFRPCRGKYRA